MEENEKKETKTQKSGVKGLLIILIILLLAVLGLEGYKLFIVGNKNNKESQKTEQEKKETSDESKNDNSTVPVGDTTVPVEDTFTIYITSVHDANNNIKAIELNYFYLKDGKLFLLNKNIEDTCTASASLVCFGYKSSTIDPENFEKTSNDGKEITGLSNIKRLKGFFNQTTGEGPSLLLVTESGEVYSYGIVGHEDEAKFNKVLFLDDYKVDDVISYNVVGGCVNNGDPNFKTCGGSYHIIDQDGNTQHYKVNTDGTLTQE